MLQFPLQELMDERRCYEYLLKVLHPEGLQCLQGHPLSEEQQPHDRHREPIVDYRCRECGAVFNLFTGTVWSGTRYICSQIVLRWYSLRWRSLPCPCEDPRGLPRVQAEGAYGNGPTREWAQRAGFRLQAPSRGKAQPGVGTIRNAVERCHNFFAQFGRVFRRFDRSARHYLGWFELAAYIILLRAGFVS
jgi:hypothetical protein